MKEIFNLTQHKATQEQIDSGVIDIDNHLIKDLLTFENKPSSFEILGRALKISDIAVSLGAKHVMIGGAPFFMSALESALKDKGIRVLYAFSKRESIDSHQEDGSVKKIAVFKHVGFVEV